MEIHLEKIQSNVGKILERVDTAYNKAGRTGCGVKVVCVSKTVTSREISELVNLGMEDFGENRLQVAESKISELTDKKLTWHYIGNLQRKKVKKVMELFSWIHSINSVSVAREAGKRQRERAQNSKRIPFMLVEVNIHGEESKLGCDLEELNEVLRVCAEEKLNIKGLMTMAPYTDDRDLIRSVFRKLRTLRDQLRPQYPGLDLSELSMGMSNDYEIAVEEGATIIRVGSAFFE